MNLPEGRTDAAGTLGQQHEPQRRLRSRLRAETAAHHRALEARLDLLSPDASLERYVLVLRALHGYHAAIEPRLRALARSTRPGFRLRARAELLVRDLLALGVRREAVASAPRCHELPSVRRPEHLAGCLYVLEGARLGGRIVARAVGDRFGLTAEHGCAFFSNGGEDPSRRWASFVAWLDAQAAGADADVVVASAVETFRTLDRWLALRGALR